MVIILNLRSERILMRFGRLSNTHHEYHKFWAIQHVHDCASQLWAMVLSASDLCAPYSFLRLIPIRQFLPHRLASLRLIIRPRLKKGALDEVCSLHLLLHYRPMVSNDYTASLTSLPLYLIPLYALISLWSCELTTQRSILDQQR